MSMNIDSCFLQRTNKVAQITSAFIVTICLFCLEPFTFKIYNSYALVFLFAYLVAVFFGLSNMIVINKKEVVYVLFTVVYYFFTLFFTGGGLGSVITPTVSMALIIIMKNCRVGTKTMSVFKVIFSVIFIVCIMKCRNYFTNWSDKDINSFNPNTLGFLTAYSMIFILILMKEHRTRLKKTIVLFLLILTVSAIWQYKSRASLIMFSSFLIFKLVPLKLKKNKYFTISVFIGILSIGILFPYIMVQIQNSRINIQLPFIGDLFSGKGLFTGREVIWNNFFMEMSRSIPNWFIGIGSRTNIMYNGGTHINPHNIYILTSMNFGAIGFILYFGFYIMQLKTLYSYNKPDDFQVDLIYGAFSFFILDIFETTSLWIAFIPFMSLLWGMAGGCNLVERKRRNHDNCFNRHV